HPVEAEEHDIELSVVKARQVARVADLEPASFALADARSRQLDHARHVVDPHVAAADRAERIRRAPRSHAEVEHIERSPAGADAVEEDALRRCEIHLEIVVRIAREQLFARRRHQRAPKPAGARAWAAKCARAARDRRASPVVRWYACAAMPSPIIVHSSVPVDPVNTSPIGRIETSANAVARTALANGSRRASANRKV